MGRDSNLRLHGLHFIFDCISFVHCALAGPSMGTLFPRIPIAWAEGSPGYGSWRAQAADHFSFKVLISKSLGKLPAVSTQFGFRDALHAFESEHRCLFGMFED